MTREEREARFQQVEEVVALLVECGFTPEELSTQDLRDEPYKVTIVLSCTGQDPEGGYL
jgi:hypothetical protein